MVSIVRTGQGPGSCLVIQTSSRVYYLHTSPYRIDPSTKAKMKKKKTLQHLGQQQQQAGVRPFLKLSSVMCKLKLVAMLRYFYMR